MSYVELRSALADFLIFLDRLRSAKKCASGLLLPDFLMVGYKCTKVWDSIAVVPAAGPKEKSIVRSRARTGMHRGVQALRWQGRYRRQKQPVARQHRPSSADNNTADDNHA